MTTLVAGQNTVISQSRIEAVISYVKKASCVSDVDASAFLISPEGKVNTPFDFVFYGQKESSDKSVHLSLEAGKATFSIDTSKVSELVDKIPLTVVIDGHNTIADLESLSVQIGDIEYHVDLAGRSEKAVILAHVYRHNGAWKVKALGDGFNGGLGPLAGGYGIETSNEPAQAPAAPVAPVPAPALKTVSLAKKLEEKAPRLVCLAKTIEVNLQKHKLETVKAKVAFVLDASGSMSNQFSRGNVQAVLDRIAALATQFDDDGNMELWGFASRHKKYEDVTLDNLDNYIEKIKGGKGGWFDILPGLGCENNEPPVMKEVLDTFHGSTEPVIIYFITDGGIYKDKDITKLIVESANRPIYWKFVGLGGSNYGVLDRLDNIQGRVVDNTDFFPIDDFKKVSDNDLYDRLLCHISDWMKEARQKSILMS